MFKKLIVVAAVIAMYLHFYPNEQVNSWLGGQKDMATKKFTEITNTKVQIKPRILLKQLDKDFAKFSKLEKKYVQTIVVDRPTLAKFSADYCGTEKKNSKLRAKNVKLVCDNIVQYRIFRK